MTFVGMHREEKKWSNRQNPAAIVGWRIDRARGCLRFTPVSAQERAAGPVTRKILSPCRHRRPAGRGFSHSVILFHAAARRLDWLELSSFTNPDGQPETVMDCPLHRQMQDHTKLVVSLDHDRRGLPHHRKVM